MRPSTHFLLRTPEPVTPAPPTPPAEPRHTTSLASAAARRRIVRTVVRRAGRHYPRFARIAGTAALAPGSYSLEITATGADGQEPGVATVKFWVLT